MSLELSARTTALILIDLQKGILSRTAVPHSVSEVVEKSTALAGKMAEAGGTIVLVHVGFSDGYVDKLNQSVDAPTPVPPGSMPAEWMEFVPEIAALPATVIIKKRQWGAFHGTELDLQLRRRGITTIVLAGVSTNFGVESTAREAWQHNYSVIVAEDACGSMDADMHHFSIQKILPRIARVRSTAEIIDAFKTA